MTISEFQEKFGIVGNSKEIHDLVDITMQVATSDITVLISGESGVGKEVFANAIHNYSNRRDKRLVSVNCGAIPEGLLESELFGHKKGSFTGATEDRRGYFEIADEGTLFLDEIAEMPLTTQVKFLRVLETKEFMRLGGETVTKVDVRIIAASNKDLRKEVDAKKFRNDLYFRLKAVNLNIPPLRSRKEDITALIYHFLNDHAETHNKNPEITREGIEILTGYSWPGNVRELKNVIETAFALSKHDILDAADFIPLLSRRTENEVQRNLPVHMKRSPEELDREMIYRALIDIKKDLIDLKKIAIRYDGPNGDLEDPLASQEVLPLDIMEKKAIENALKFAKWNKRTAAKLLNISERTLYRKLKEYEIQ
jgi:transcriptional regulator with PAS, ATPase and Fis domain